MNARHDIGGTLGGVLYKDVKRAILSALAQGEWKPGAAIPSERQLTGRFGVSIGTLRKAIDELVAEGIIVRHQGRGTFVATHRQEEHFFRFFRIARKDGHREYPTVRLVRFRRGRADAQEARHLQLESSAPVFRFTNLLSLGGEPVVVDAITVPEKHFQALTERQLRDRPSTLYNFYQDAFGINVIRTEEHLSAIVADAADQELLGVPAGSPIMEIHRIASSYNDERVEFRISHVDTRNHEFLLSQP